MDISDTARRIAVASHSDSPIQTLSQGQVVVEDTRLRSWSLSASGGLDYANPIVARLNGDGDILRVRTIDGAYIYNGILDIRYATPSANISWSSNTITESALGGCGVDLWIDGNDIDVFWVDSDARTNKTSHSSDGGHTWVVSATVSVVPAQGLNVLIQLCAPQLDTLIYTDSTIGQDDSGNSLTGLYVVVKSSGTWQVPVSWDLGGQPLGVEQKVVLPNGDEYPSNLSGLTIGDGRVEIAYYGKQLQESFEDGVWVQRIGNLKFVAPSAQHLHWTHPQQIFETVGIDDDNNSTQVFAAFPRLQMVGSEYWILALEASEFVGHERYHLGFFRSSDGITFTDRSFNQGASNDDPNGAYLYDESNPFLVTDIIYSNLIVTDDLTYIVSFDKVFYCPSTSLVGIDNTDRQVDLSDIVSQYTVSLPTAPASASATINLNEVNKDWNDSDILAAHRGIVVKLKGGYRTPYGDEQIDVGTFHLDKINQATEIGKSSGSITALDNTMLLDRYKSDIYWEYNSPKQLAYDKFCDLTPFLVVAGSFTTGLGGRLKSGIVNANDNFRDDIAALNTDPTNSSFCYFRFRCDRTWLHNHAGFVFQGRNQGDENDNKSYWAVLYNRTAGKFTLNRAIPRTNPNRTKLYKYESHVVQSDDILLDNSTWYWMRVGVWHGHIKVWYALDDSQQPDSNWVQVFDYKSQASPSNHVIPSRIGWNALIGTQKIQPSGALGFTGSKGGQQDLSDGTGNPRIYAVHVQLGNQPSYLRRVNVAITQENTDNTPMPDLSIQLLAGDTASPFDLTDDDNIYFAGDASALHFSVHDRPKFLGANARPNPGRPQFDPLTNLWIAVSASDVLTTGQSYKFSSDNSGSGKTMYSDDGGVTWTQWGDGSLNLTASVEVEYIYGRVKFHKMYYTSGETPKTYETLAHELAAKAGVLNITPDDYLSQSDMSLTDGVYWQPSSIDTIGDFVADVDVNVSGSPYSRIAKFIFGSSDNTTDGSNGYYVELDPDENTIAVYAPDNTVIAVASSLQHVPSNAYHLQVVNQNGFLMIYLNECLAFMHYAEGFKTAGYVGLDSLGTTWTNFRIPDLRQLVDYFALQTNESSLSALERLISKPAAGSIARGKFFILPDGSLRIGSFSRRAITDTYESNIFAADKSEDAQYVVSVVNANGNYYAQRTNAEVLDTDGRWFDVRDDTDASSDANAYLAAEGEFQDAEEKSLSESFSTVANFAQYREDAVMGLNPQDKTSQVFIVNDIQIVVGVEPTQSDMTINFRKFTDAE